MELLGKLTNNYVQIMKKCGIGYRKRGIARRRNDPRLCRIRNVCQLQGMAKGRGRGWLFKRRRITTITSHWLLHDDASISLTNRNITHPFANRTQAESLTQVLPVIMIMIMISVQQHSWSTFLTWIINKSRIYQLWAD